MLEKIRQWESSHDLDQAAEAHLELVRQTAKILDEQDDYLKCIDICERYINSSAKAQNQAARNEELVELFMRLAYAGAKAVKTQPVKAAPALMERCKKLALESFEQLLRI